MSCTTPPHRKRGRPHEEGSGRFCFFTPTMTNFAASIAPTATERNKSNSKGSKTMKSKRAPRPTMQQRNRAPRRAQHGEEWHGTWMPMESRQQEKQPMNETRVELLQHRVCHQRNAPELGLERHRHQEAQRFSATRAKTTLAMTIHHLAETTRRRVPTLTLAGVEADNATLSQND